MVRLSLGNLLRNKLVQNTGYLSVIEIFRLLMPFIALPYIIKTVGVTHYGSIVFAQAIISYFQIFINWGLDVSAVKDVSVARNDRKELDKIVSIVLSIKSIHLLLSAFLLFASSFFIPYVHENIWLLLCCFLLCFTDVLFPIWFYQGIEKMKYLALIRFISIFFYTISIFIFIRQADDYIYVPLLQSLGSILSGIVSMFLLLRVEKIRLHRVRKVEIVQTFKDSTPFFISRVSVVLNNSIAKIISGIFLTMDMVAAFDLAQKITSIALVPIQMVNQAVYPHIARTLNKVFARKMLMINIFASLLIAIAVFILAPYAIYYFSKGEVEEAVVLTRILCIWVFFGGIVVYLGSPVLVSFGHPQPFNNSILAGTFVLLCSYLLLYILGGLGNIYYFAYALCLSEFVMFSYRFFYCIKYELFSIKK
ncbi:oligosaccharide flippase family protein [uncultured Bacteroides sp.]|uniref:oligosaccharide flippase family protein n=1 Tax=uncultured Bacteroides sp. TaxID=162156 RepID=UPI00263948CA|nr:oligosaccharide flippase family protein [uncultured Bacteroides sp.]